MRDIAPVLVAYAIAGALVLIMAQIVRGFVARSLHAAITTAITTNSPLAEPLIRRLDRRPPVSIRLIGFVLIALALALFGANLLVKVDPDGWRRGLAAALFPGLTGAALLLYLRVGHERPAADEPGGR